MLDNNTLTILFIYASNLILMISELTFINRNLLVHCCDAAVLSGIMFKYLF